MAKVSVLGAGSWGTALTVMLHNNGHQVILWSPLTEEVEQLSEDREQKAKLPGVHISEDILITGDRSFTLSQPVKPLSPSQNTIRFPRGPLSITMN